MNLSFKIARRYLFAKKSTNAINVITGISVFGLAVGTAALILVLSVFNGFQDLLLSLFSNFNPEIQVTATKGKFFSPDSLQLDELYAIEGIQYISQTLEEIVLFEHNDNQRVGTIKGVDTLYQKVSSIDTTIREGTFGLEKEGLSFAVLGVGLAYRLDVDVLNQFNSINVYMPKRERVGALQQPFRKQFLHPIGTFAFQSEFDNEYVITNLPFVQRLLGEEGIASALEIKLHPNADLASTTTQVRELLGEDFTIKDQYQQEAAFLKIMNVEKWMSFAILSLTLLLVAFNMIGALWMIVLEKRHDIAILKSMGTHEKSIRAIFLYEGLLIALWGFGLGAFFGLFFFVLQKMFGIIPVPHGFVVDSYPMSLQLIDFLSIGAIVILIGLLASIPAALRAQRVPTIVKEE